MDQNHISESESLPIIHKRYIWQVVILCLLTLSIGFISGYYFARNNLKNIPSSTEQQVSTSSKIPTISNTANNNEVTNTNKKNIDPNIYDGSEYDNFPVYPNSLQTDKKLTEPCTDSEQSGYAISCNTVAYYWQTKDGFDQVSKWFETDPTNSGWKCSKNGIAGTYSDTRSASGVTLCTKNGLQRRLHILSDTIKTEYILEIPLKDYKGKFFTSTN